MLLEAPLELLLNGRRFEGTILPSSLDLVQHFLDLIEYKFAFFGNLPCHFFCFVRMHRVRILQCLPSLFEHQGEERDPSRDAVYFDSCRCDLTADSIEKEGEPEAGAGDTDDASYDSWDQQRQEQSLSPRSR